MADLEQLHSNVPPEPYAQAREVIVADLGDAPEALLASFEEDAFAAASTAQVHRATLADGTCVAVKVQRPDIDAMVRADFGVLRDVVDLASRASRTVRDLALAPLLDEFAGGVGRELDYRNEAYHAMRLADAMAAFPSTRVPKVYRELSGTRVLTMEYIDGTQVDRLDADALPQDERDALTQAFTRSLVKQLFIDGFFHGDLHPGNVMVDRATGELVLIDLGLVGRLNLRARLDLVELLVAIQQKDAGSLASLALRLTMHSRPVDAGKFRDDMGELVNQHIRYAEAQSFDSILGAFLALLQDHGMQLGEQFTIAVKTIAQSQEIVTALGGTVDFLPFVLRELAALALAEISLDRVVDLAGSHAISLAQELLRRIPGLDIVLPPQPDDVPPDRPQLSKGPDQLSLRLDRIQSTAANTGAGLVISLLTIGTAILTTAISQLVPVFLVLLVAGVMFAWRIPRPSSKR